MLANITSSNTIAQEVTVPGPEHLLDLRAESEDFLGLQSGTPLQDMNLNETEAKHYDAKDFKLTDDPLPADFYKSF